MWINVGDSKGKPMSDKRMLLTDFFTEEELALAKREPIVLIYKDLGRQISWQLVFLIEYFGPILFTLLYVVFQ